MEDASPPLPPFDEAAARLKVRLAEDGWNTRDPDGSSSPTPRTRSGATARSSSVGREQVRAFLQRKRAGELDYRLIKELWAFGERRIAVRFAYEWHDDSGQWFR